MNTINCKSTFTLLLTDYVKLNKNWNYKNVTSVFCRILYIDDGEGKLICNLEEYILEPGFMYLIPSFTTCSYICDHYLSHHYICLLEEFQLGALFSSNRKVFKLPAGETDIASIKRIVKLNPGRGLHTSNNPKVYEVDKVLTDYYHLNNVMPLSAYMETCGLLLQLVARFLQSPLFLNTEVSHIDSKIANAIFFMQNHLSDPISVSMLAKEANYHSDHFSRLFLKNTGVRPLDYLKSKRVERSQFLLATTNMTFYEIANQLGFESQAYFSRVFKSITGFTPGQYKKSISGKLVI
ncbi:AraC family transcriptional regulator [Pedobacter frigoris]|uniref:AraC family transcriptional regulator n=1 Tax=Pedobacter frigoris TaxID=2571272 RepID=UPI00292F8BD5|nr:AraC family transcriptional regulator [Pedobacter frigoris]